MRSLLIAALAASLSTISLAAATDDAIVGCILEHGACSSLPEANLEACGVTYEQCLETIFNTMGPGARSDLKSRNIPTKRELAMEQVKAREAKHKKKHKGKGDPGSEPPTGTNPGGCYPPDCEIGVPPVYPPPAQA